MLEAVIAEFPTKKRYLVGVSGGWDSMALLEALLREGYQNLLVCHLNHRLRGLESDEDAEFVRFQAEAHGLTCVVECEDVAERAQRNRQSVETAARYARYDFFERCAAKHGVRHLFLAHQAHDQAETMLLNLCRGTGRRGLTGMHAVTEFGNLTVIRPLLQRTRQEIPAPSCFRQDASNLTLAYSRNRVRWGLMVALTEVLGRDPTPGLVRTASILDEEEDYLQEVAEAKYLVAVMDDGALRVREMRNHHPALQRRIIRLWLSEEGVAEVSFENVEAVRRLLQGGKPSRINLAGDRHVARRQKTLIVE